MHRVFSILSQARFIPYLGHFIFFIHFFFAIIFVYERTLYADAANFIFQIINQEDFFIASGRYGAMPTQLLPLLAVKLGASLKIILLTYSVSCILCYYLLFLLVVYFFKNRQAGLIIAFSLLLCLRHNYFMLPCEMHIAIIYCLTLYAFMEYYYRSKPFGTIIYIVCVVLMITLCIISHPAILFAIVFILFYEAIDKKELKDFKIYIFVFVIILLCVAKAYFTGSDSYEGNMMTQILNIGPLLLNITQVYSFKYLFTRFPTLYWAAFIMGGVMLYWYYKQKDWLKLLLLVGVTGIFLLVSIVIYHEGDSEMMMERAYSMLVIFVMVPFMKDFFSVQKQQSYYVAFVMIVMTISFVGIYKTGKGYHKRVEYITGLLEKYKSSKQSKYIIVGKKLNNDLILVPWAFALETLIYSSLEGPQYGKTFYIVDDVKTFEYNLGDKELFLAVPFWRDWNVSDLNQDYFHLPQEEYKDVGNEFE